MRSKGDASGIVEELPNEAYVDEAEVGREVLLQIKFSISIEVMCLLTNSLLLMSIYVVQEIAGIPLNLPY